MKYLSNGISLSLGDKREPLVVLTNLLKTKNIKNISLYKQSIDARKKDSIKIVSSYVFDSDEILNPKLAKLFVPKVNVIDQIIKTDINQKVLVVGSGPSGLFASLLLAYGGAKVTLIEKGGNLLKRKTAVNSINNRQSVDKNTNIQNGIGGAGTFSDGKLTTGINSPYIYSVFDTFARFGASKEIYYSNTPHIGSDVLPNVINNFCQHLLDKGVEILFDTPLLDIKTVGQKVECVFGNTTRTFDKVILACGHSAYDIFTLLYSKHALIEPKPFSMGVRIEHKREMIDFAQYGVWATKYDLPTADYKLVEHLLNNRTVYSFCMCPGGSVVNSTDEPNVIVTNGMSNFDRKAPNSNSALLVNVTVNDYFRDSPLDGIGFIKQYEKKAFVVGGSNGNAPSQNTVDFLSDKLTTKFDVQPSFLPNVTSALIKDCLPDFVYQSLKTALPRFDSKIKGFSTNGVLTAVESRTSSPVKICRDNNMMSTISNVYPIGEGAGYAGGIVSSAIDGIKVALTILGQ